MTQTPLFDRLPLRLRNEYDAALSVYQAARDNRRPPEVIREAWEAFQALEYQARDEMAEIAAEDARVEKRKKARALRV